MQSKKIIVNIIGWTIIGCFVINMILGIIQFIPAVIELSQLKFYPENVPLRSVNSTDGFVLLWSKNTENGTEHRVFTQIFTPDDENLVYVTTNSINSIDYLSGETLWMTSIPEDTTFHFYGDKLFTLNSHDSNVPFASIENISIPSKCNSMDRSTLRVYDPYSGKKMWEYSYKMVYPDKIFFKDNMAVISGLTIAVFNKYISEFSVDVQSGQIMGVTCQNYREYSYFGKDEGILSSGFYPILDERDWKDDTEDPTYVVDGTKLMLVDSESRQKLASIEFSGFSLNPYDVDLINHEDLLIVYLNDSNQFFAFQAQK